MHIFISYAKEDTQQLTKQLAAELEQLPSITVWWDTTIQPGDSWSAQIQDEIQRCDLFMVLLSPDVNRPRTTQKSGSFVLKEINYALNKGKVVLPIMAEATDLPVQLADLQYIDLTRNKAQGLAKIMDFVRQMADIPPSKKEAEPAELTDIQSKNWRIWGGIGIIGLLLLIGAIIFVLSNTDDKTNTERNGYPDGENITANNDWKPVTREFEYGDYTVPMMLVPKGCFQMGNDPDISYYNNGWIRGIPDGGKVCFDEPFWIDKYEVSNAQFTVLGGVSEFTGNWNTASFPRENIKWTESLDFCRDYRTARLPTEAEWEYAARGPESWIYPWGNEFVSTRLNCIITDCPGDGLETPSSVEIFESGQSWVGAYNLSGNIAEWVNTIYDPNTYPYPYTATDGRETTLNINTQRGLRGGSFDDQANSTRGAARIGSPTDFTNALTGFRCARDYDE